MSVTTVDIDRELLEEAKQVLGTTTTRATIHEALTELVMRRRQTEALDIVGALDLESDAVKVDVMHVTRP